MNGGKKMRYNFRKIEPKWQKAWADAQAFKAVDFDKRPKWYGLVEFPYPSGAGMHVGHIKAYSSIEVLARKRRMQGYNVLFPIGWLLVRLEPRIRDLAPRLL